MATIIKEGAPETIFLPLHRIRQFTTMRGHTDRSWLRLRNIINWNTLGAFNGTTRFLGNSMSATNGTNWLVCNFKSSINDMNMFDGIVQYLKYV